MPGSTKCPPECACAKHRDRRRSLEEVEASRQRRLARSREYMRRRRLADPEGHRAAAREQYKTHGRKHWLKWKFGMTLSQWDEMLAAQTGCCYLCVEPLVEGSIHIDHDRSCCRGNQSCGTCIRGLACQKCNQGIGQFGDDPERMRRVADNLEMANRRLHQPRPIGLKASSNALAGR